MRTLAGNREPQARAQSTELTFLALLTTLKLLNLKWPRIPRMTTQRKNEENLNGQTASL